MLLAELEKYGDAIDAINKIIAYVFIELKTIIEEENTTLLLKAICKSNFS